LSFALLPKNGSVEHGDNLYIALLASGSDDP
jgi:hypothetical protein